MSAPRHRRSPRLTRAQRFPLTTAVALAIALLAKSSCNSRGPVTSRSGADAFHEIDDLAGRRVRVPRAPKRVLAFGHSFAILVALAPDLLVARPGPFKANPQAAAFLPPGIAELPQLSSGHDIDPERVKEKHFDLAVGWDTAAFRREQLAMLDRVSVPAVLVGVDRLEQYPATFRLLGQVLGRQARAESLARAIEAALDRMSRLVAGIPAERRLKVFYAEGMDGLTSQCGLDGRAEVLRLAGARNAVPCEGTFRAPSPADVESHNASVDVESIMTLSPDVIVTRFDRTADMIRTDARWQRLSAVKNGLLFAIPQFPFNWFDRPPSFMRALGMQWLAKLLYPDLVSIDVRRETTEFYSLFFGVVLAAPDLDRLLGQVPS
jgi:iron complex transport system substrate-binding protein